MGSQVECEDQRDWQFRGRTLGRNDGEAAEGEAIMREVELDEMGMSCGVDRICLVRTNRKQGQKREHSGNFLCQLKR